MKLNPNFTTDLHTHSSFSHDSEELTENYVIEAIRRGENRIGFVQHYDYDCHLVGDNTPLCDIDAYRNEILRLRDKYHTQIAILFGIEFGFDKRAEEHYAEVVAKYNFDYVINSVHLIVDKDCCYPSVWEKRTPQDVYKIYLDNLHNSVGYSFPWQIVGHIGYPMRYAPCGAKLHYDDFSKELDEILKLIIAQNKILEINSSTKGRGISLPNDVILQRYCELGGKLVSFGSDAHSVERYEEKLDKVKAIIEKYKFICMG